MRGKKKAIARIASLFGITSLVESLPLPPKLLILNYHRIGSPSDTPYDPGNYSSTAEDFDWQVAYLKSHFDILTLDQAVAVVEARSTLARPSVLITFDDGYEDNYLHAYPILLRHGVPASFFLPTAYIGTSTLPWWDEIAFVLRYSQSSEITLTYPGTHHFDLTPPHLAHSIASILELYKTPENTDHERFIAGLEAACRCPRPVLAPARCFLNWDEAREMQAHGMTFGSHTHTHPLLSKLTFQQQVNELRTSRDILERELNCPIDTIAYPVGQRDSFSSTTVEAARHTGYRLAFSLYSGINHPGKIDAYNVLRTGIHSESHPSMRLLTALQFVFPNSLA